MFARDQIVSLVALALGLTLVVAGPGGVGAEGRRDQSETPRRGTIAPDRADEGGSAARRQTKRVMKLDKQTTGKLDKLPDNQLLDVRGKKMTVRAYKVLRVKEQKQGAARIKAMFGDNAKDLAAVQMDFEKAEEARLSAANAKVEAEVAMLGKQPAGITPPTNAEAIRSEALAIQKRVRGGTASPADKKRAQELFDQYQQLK